MEYVPREEITILNREKVSSVSEVRREDSSLGCISKGIFHTETDLLKGVLEHRASFVNW